MSPVPSMSKETLIAPGFAPPKPEGGGANSPGKKKGTGDSTEKLTPEKLSQRAAVKDWLKKIDDSKRYFDKDFKRMRQDMQFAAGLQWPDQKSLEDDDNYTSNITLRQVQQKVASLYARNPTVVAKRRKRLDFQLWDEKVETLQAALQSAIMSGGADIASAAIVQDYIEGTKWRAMVDKIGRTFEIVYKWMLENQVPGFKLQAKQWVRRVVICGVGYCKQSFVRSFEGKLSTSETESALNDRVTSAEYILEKIRKKEIEIDDKQVEYLNSLFTGIATSLQNGDTENINERLVYDFPPSTSIIVDKHCRQLKGFVGAHWIAQEYNLPVEIINAYFDVDVKLSGPDGATKLNANDTINPPPKPGSEGGKTHCRLFEVWDLDTKTTFFVVEGWKDYVQEPESVFPMTNVFWPMVALTFNDIETDGEEETKVSIYPPSDVRLMRSDQKEINRAGEAKREHRMANTPGFMTGKGWLTDPDKNAIRNRQPHQLIEIQGAGAQAGADLTKLVAPFPTNPFDPNLYDIQQSLLSIQLSVGAQESNLGPVSKGTATAATIAEQSRTSTGSSNVDDLDDALSILAQAGGEMLLRELQLETVQRIAGRRAVWPEGDRQDYLNELFLDVQAASSGRPNKALEVANGERLLPMLAQFGANPQFLVRETIRRLDDQLEPQDAFPLVPPGLMGGGAMQQPGGKPNQQPNGNSGPQPTQPGPTSQGGQQPLQQLPSQSPVPLAGH